MPAAVGQHRASERYGLGEMGLDLSTYLPRASEVAGREGEALGGHNHAKPSLALLCQETKSTRSAQSVYLPRVM